MIGVGQGAIARASHVVVRASRGVAREMLSQRDASWKAVVPEHGATAGEREPGDDPDALTRALDDGGFLGRRRARAETAANEGEEAGVSDEYVTDIEDIDDDDDGDKYYDDYDDYDEDNGVGRAGDASADESDGEGLGDAELGRSRGNRQDVSTAPLLRNTGATTSSSARCQKSSGTSRQSRRLGGAGRGKKSTVIALRRKAERRAYKPVTFPLLIRLFGLYVTFMILNFAFIIVTALGALINPFQEAVIELNALENVVWLFISCASFVAIPSCVAHVSGYLTWPPVWLEQFPERGKLLEELGGKIYFRFHVARDTKPVAVKRAVDVAVDILSRSIPSPLWEVEVVTMKELGVSATGVSELVVPVDMYNSVNSSSTLLEYATRASTASWGDWVVHMGSDALLNVRAVDAVLAHCARETRLAALSGRGETHVRRLAQGAVLPGITRTANSFVDGVENVFQWIPAMAECIRAGESYGALRVMYARHSRVVAPIPNTYLVVPNELELAVGFGNMDVHDGFELTSFALRCSNNGVKFSWLDAGVHVPIVANIWKLFKVRARDHHSALVLMRDEAALDHTHRASLSLACVSAGFSTIAPVLTAFSPWFLHRSGVDTFAVSCVVGFITACVTFKYAIGFYKSASAIDLARGSPGLILYSILFVMTIVLTPVFCVFEFIALCTSIFYSPNYFGAEKHSMRAPVVKILSNDDDDDWPERGRVREVLLEDKGASSSSSPVEAPGSRHWRRGSAGKDN